MFLMAYNALLVLSLKSNFQVRFARKYMINSLKLIVRQNQDQGATRLRETTSPCSMEINLIQFVKQWQGIEICGERILKHDKITAIEKLKVHIKKGCLSGIPVFLRANQNESLHRILNKVVKKSRIGIQLAIFVLGLFLYQWNERKLSNLNLRHL